MKTKNIIYLALFFLSFSIHGEAQTLKAFVAAAENAYVSKDYYSALMYYNNALEFDEESIDLNYKSAEASRLFNAYTKAEVKYQYVVDNDSNEGYPLATFWLADVKQKLGKYAEAKELFELYLSENNGEQYFIDKATKEIKACTWAANLASKPDESVTIEHLGDGINSPYSEFAGLYRNEELFFSSLRYEKEDDVYNPNRLISKILKSEDETTGQLIEDSINENEVHTAHSTFNTAEDKIYYTECEYVNTTEIRCNIFSRAVNEDGSFGEKVKLPSHINMESNTSSQPNVGFDQKLKRDVLYFVSDREGGKGKLDIWFATIEGDNLFSAVINAGEINTHEDDITPFFHSASQMLYFSSEGYQTLGGFDIFKSSKENGFLKADHLPLPINSSYHDIYYSLDNEGNKAHLSSNRLGSYYLETAQEACCYDIYRADFEEILLSLDAQTFDKKTLADLPGATVKLYDKRTGELIGELTNDENIHHKFNLKRDHEYQIIAERQGYLSDTIDVTTNDLYQSEDIIKKLFLERDFTSASVTNLTVLTFDGVTSKELNGTTVRLIDVETGQIIGQQKYNANGNDFNWQIIPGKEYQVIASKNGYDTNQTTFYAEANADGSAIVKRVYLGRGAGSYLPLTLYFDNDIPDLRSVKTYTNKTYTSTYNPYIVKKEEFKTKYGRKLKGESRFRSDQNLESFFEFDVKGGYGQMNAFLEQLKTELIQGRKITISIKGYASPRASTKYNLALSKRRIHSLKNEMVKYSNGILAEYIVSNQLKIVDLPFGESNAPSGISDKIGDRRNSIYSVEASKERRIEILGLTYK